MIERIVRKGVVVRDVLIEKVMLLWYNNGGIYWEVDEMQMCPDCEKVYDESEYAHCPYCSGELYDDDDDEVRPCPNCGGCLVLDGDEWVCTNCDYAES